ncbi:hypothetical protein PVAP13_2KG547000 [Panicum virgatum]|uniref:Uncharacterized protein n=1 Tax=Panicum virgatum TaxID=38727 RepID=A0A8T0WI96_PANVG|nr:hypothetical protein PVAP13_2KG547000 [Panicum virgatum]
MTTELRFPVVEVLLSRRIRFLRVFGDDDGDSFGMGFGENHVRCFCPLCLAWSMTAVAVRCFCLLSFRSGGWEGGVPISSDGGMRFAFSSFAKRGESFSSAVGLDAGLSVTAADVFSGRQLLGLRCVMLVLSGRW